MYPFERFTEKAKKALTLAQDEAEKSHHSYISTEHLLLGLLREDDGQARKVLSNLGVEIETVRATIASVLGRTERTIVQQIIPTSRVKKVIEIAFEEAKRTGTTYVGTEHLLLGLLIEEDGIAAHVLVDLGAPLDRVREELAALPPDLDASAPEQQDPHHHVQGRAGWTSYAPLQGRTGFPTPTPQQWTERLTPEAKSCLVLAEEEGVKAGLGYIGGEHLLLGLLRQGEGRAARVLGLLGLTTDGAREAVGSANLDAPRQMVAQVTWNSDLDLVLSVAADLASLRQAEWADTEDLLQALCRLPNSSRVCGVLQNLGITADAVRESLGRLATEGT
ncbi:MAG: Clp protease N-terminal domain-containing protein [Candidatus Dormibacteria bacterium]